MTYKDRDGMLRGKRGGLSIKNSDQSWANHYGGYKPSQKGTSTRSTGPYTKEDISFHNELKEMEDERAYIKRRGFDPDDPNDVMDLENYEGGPEDYE